MKVTLTAIAIAIAALFGSATNAEAGNFGVRIHTGGYGGFGGYGGSYYHGRSCAPRYVVRTCEINRCQHRRIAYRPCGTPFSYYITVVTYRAYYSDGSSYTFTRTFS
ncbi:MAG: hypothetical protein AAGA96_04905 [Verrucomicrobiota bacterium]